MPHYRYLIVGGGIAADAAIRSLLEVDPQADIGLIGDEPHPPHNRPPLSKGLWRGKPLDKIWRGTPTDRVAMHLGRHAVGLDPKGKTVTDDRGMRHEFDKLLLATGGTPRKLPFDAPAVIYYRTLDDYHQLRQQAERGSRFAVVGGGFIGSEMAAALASLGKSVTLIFPEMGIGARLFPEDLARFLNRYYTEKGVEVLPGRLLVGARTEGEGLRLTLRRAADGDSLERVVDGVVAGLGIDPNASLARTAGLAVGGGILVDEFLQTSHPDMLAAGDVAEFPNLVLGKLQRVEHEDNALTMGRVAGRNMAGERTPYHHLPYFYSDLFDLGYEAVGELDARLQTVVDWQEPNRKGVIYYLQDERVRGVLLWNVWDQVDAARALIAEPGPHHPEALKGRLPA
ncbi:MAG: FAD/NAD(P)-binding oxidoreductase [Chloroflexota bacterium]